ncbi:hypothetical protein GGX14DRAFT_465527 [Mycena pura]|uniref:WW domain-containing protein n=1 Tax=Mycena pura TaxID=153505 RepID=A0AAD6V365_9AGAR|nr:hypothetical protein GGX14DRAFT_465527 [Mycena pura]
MSTPLKTSKEPSPAPNPTEPPATSDASEPAVATDASEPVVATDVSETSAATETPADSAESPLESAQPAPEQQQPPTAWQAIFSPQYNAYYFYNSETQETTWTNPLQPPSGAEASTSATAAEASVTVPGETSQPQSSILDPHYAAIQSAAIAQGIDPALAYLDPSLAASTSAGGPAGAALPQSFHAKFNARTGQFTALDGRTPDHLSEYERAKRMSEVFFDVAAWEQNLAEERAAEAEAGGKKRKRPTKKDLERFKQQKKLKKIAKTAWLRT